MMMIWCHNVAKMHTSVSNTYHIYSISSRGYY